MFETIKFKVAAAIFGGLFAVILTLGGLYLWERSDNKDLIKANSELSGEVTRLKDAAAIKVESDKLDEKTGLNITTDTASIEKGKVELSKDLNAEFEELVKRYREENGIGDVDMSISLEAIEELIRVGKDPAPLPPADPQAPTPPVTDIGKYELAQEVKRLRRKEALRIEQSTAVSELALAKAWESYCTAVPTDKECAVAQ